ncbi:sporulation initiation phosphotransferase F [bacterium BMS3Abin07]|nr:sporulation initiation phosphotransferase F [bacterium BMS3Abin07]GBE32826.1 sporulation initiation phosphotransferase F [bacterium BMS3Bbin05]HDO22732.1 response regulator [Nitrospirota bacterium]HDZ88958.1 response regulator [Nitrospirota bacterium]
MNRKILVIDDEKNMCTLCRRVLNKKGFDVKITTSALDAIGLVEKEDFMLLVVDLRMPEMGGVEFIKRARQAGFRNKCIIVTAYPNIDAMKEAKKQGVSDFLIKPFSILELEEAVLRAVDITEHKEVV